MEINSRYVRLYHLSTHLSIPKMIAQSPIFFLEQKIKQKSFSYYWKKIGKITDSSRFCLSFFVLNTAEDEDSCFSNPNPIWENIIQKSKHIFLLYVMVVKGIKISQFTQEDDAMRWYRYREKREMRVNCTLNDEYKYFFNPPNT